MINPKTIISVLLVGFSYSAFPQSGISHEIGVIAGPLEFRSDYGERNNEKTNTRNVGYAFGIIDYLTFSYRNNLNPYFSEHFRVRTELSYSKTDLHHYGKWVDNDRNTIGVRQLRAMYGSSQLINFGPQLEFSPLNIHRFERSDGAFGPYIGVGAQISYYTATAGTTMGELGNPLTTFAKYLVPSDGHPHGYSNESKVVFSGIINLGTRYKLTPLSDLLLNIQAQYFNSDWVDGLNPNKDSFKENKDYDSTVWIAFGYIYYLDD